MGGARRRRPAALSVAAALAVAGGSALWAAPGAPTTTSPLGDKPKVRSYPVFDAKGRPAGTRAWRVTSAGGNCCEVLVAATPSGRLLEFGGTYPAYSDDQGRTWTEVAPLVPSTERMPVTGNIVGGGEGAITVAPGGDIVGVSWDPYSGDRLQSFHYDGETKQWQYQEAPLHEPFYDREWIVVAKGPFRIAGQEVPWVSLVVSNFHRRIVLMSTDGLHYFVPTQRQLDGLRNQAVRRALRVVRDPEMDYMQPHTQTNIVGLAEGGALSFDVSGCSTQLLGSDGSWSCFTFPGGRGISGRLLVDSRGWLHLVSSEGTGFHYAISKDGGVTWTERTMDLPGEPVIERWDYKANGKLGLTAIAVHTRKSDGNHQDMVVRFDTRSGRPVHRDTMFLGNGDAVFTFGMEGSAGDRMDFTTVAILPDGRIAAGFGDKNHRDPTIAVLV